MIEKESNSTTSNKKLLRKAIKLTIKELQTFKEIGQDRSSIILSQDAVGKELAKKNQSQFEKYSKSNFQNNTDSKINMLADILFRNFDIQTATIEVLKCYIDEYFDRFKNLDKTLSKTLVLLDKQLNNEEI